MAQSGSRLIPVFTRYLYNAAGSTSGGFPELRQVSVVSARSYPGTWRWQDVVAAGASVAVEPLATRQRAVDSDATVLIMYTSGTTGFPKGVMHNHNVLRNVTDEANRMAVRPRDVILMYLPLFHAFGLYEGPLMSLVTGARQVLMEPFDPGEALRLIASERVTMIYGFDTHFQDRWSTLRARRPTAPACVRPAGRRAGQY